MQEGGLSSFHVMWHGGRKRSEPRLICSPEAVAATTLESRWHQSHHHHHGWSCADTSDDWTPPALTLRKPLIIGGAIAGAAVIAGILLKVLKKK